MSPFVHRLYISSLVAIVVVVSFYLAFSGFQYYSTSLEERFYHPHHDWFKPSGAFGHGLGIFGTLLILIGVFGYIARKRYLFLARFGRLKYWLEFHIFLCTLGPIMILFHTAFKFGGIVSISFWSMVAVVASGVIGRFIYIQIPRTIEGRELSLGEIRAMQLDLAGTLRERFSMDERQVDQLVATTRSAEIASQNILVRYWQTHRDDRRRLRTARGILREAGLDRQAIRQVTGLIKSEIRINHRIERLQTMVKLFKYWHVAHLPFALIMLIIMVIHVVVTLLFGYRWIF
ncbi:MAG: hypothetical protein R2787_17965 [Saprospiraceae bacterium]|nr:hypothetical protein [Lewinellaceae bacterium]HRW76176.1 hypothetical protein [Saprospiraceae bacterium]